LGNQLNTFTFVTPLTSLFRRQYNYIQYYT
jgi:hypothetical protein